MRLLTGDETGLIKSYQIEESKLLSRFGSQHKENSINQIQFFDSSESKVLTSTTSKVQIYSLNEGIYQEMSTDISFDKKIVKSHLIGDNIIVNFANGDNIVLKYQDGDYETQEMVSSGQIKIQNTIQNPFKKNQVMVLAKDDNPRVLDLENNNIIWQSRNSSHDYLDLKQPVNDLDACYTNSGKQVYVSTGFNRIKFYDVNQGKKQPVFDQEIKWEASPFNNILLKDYYQLIVSNFIGSVFFLDTRKNLAMTNKINVSKNTVKHMSIHPTQDYLACVGLDRFVKVYNLQTKDLVNQQFLKQKLSKVLFSSELLDEEQVTEEKLIEYNHKHPQIKKKVDQDIAQKYQLKRKNKSFKYVVPEDSEPSKPMTLNYTTSQEQKEKKDNLKRKSQQIFDKDDTDSDEEPVKEKKIKTKKISKKNKIH